MITGQQVVWKNIGFRDKTGKWIQGLVKGYRKSIYRNKEEILIGGIWYEFNNMHLVGVGE